jgi:hypothetical protein
MHDEKEKLQLELCALLPIAFQIANKAMLANLKRPFAVPYRTLHDE